MLKAKLIGAATIASAVCSTAAFAESYNYSVIDVPGSIETKSIANSKDIVAGSYTLPDGRIQLFRYKDGKIRTFQAPQPFPNSNIVPTAIGPTGVIAGYYGNDATFPFRLLPSADAPERLRISTGQQHATPTAVAHNNSGSVAGYLTAQDGTITAFFAEGTELEGASVPNASSTTFTAVAFPPGHTYTQPAGNYYTDQQHGFLDASTKPIDPPGSINTSLTYLNDNGDLGGYFIEKPGYTFGWVRRDVPITRPVKRPGIFAVYQVPGEMFTTVTRNIGDVVFGEFKDRFGRSHGYIFKNGQYYLVGVYGPSSLTPSPNDETTLTSVADDGSFSGSIRGGDGKLRGYVATCGAGVGLCSP